MLSHDAAKESNLPSRGLPGPASFEDWMGHQARAAPALMLRRHRMPPRDVTSRHNVRKQTRPAPLSHVMAQDSPQRTKAKSYADVIMRYGD
jgi:hypothetical protein